MSKKRPIHDEACRTEARDLAQTGMAYLARAFNHCGTAALAHRYTDEVQRRFEELAVEIVGLVENGAIEANPAHAQHLRALAARNDHAVQSVIRRASRKTRIRAT